MDKRVMLKYLLMLTECNKVIITSKKAKQIIQEEVLKKQRLNKKSVLLAEQTSNALGFSWIPESPPIAMVEGINETREAMRLPKFEYTVDADGNISEADAQVIAEKFWGVDPFPREEHNYREWVLNNYVAGTYNPVTQDLRGGGLRPGLDSLPDGNAVFRNWSSSDVSGVLGYQNSLAGFSEFYGYNGLISKDSELSDEWEFAWFVGAAQAAEDDTPEERCETAEANARRILMLVNLERENAKKIEEHLVGFTTHDKFVKVAQILRRAIGSDSPGMPKTRALLSVYAASRRTMPERAVAVVSGAVSFILLFLVQARVISLGGKGIASLFNRMTTAQARAAVADWQIIKFLRTPAVPRQPAYGRGGQRAGFSGDENWKRLTKWIAQTAAPNAPYLVAAGTSGLASDAVINWVEELQRNLQDCPGGDSVAAAYLTGMIGQPINTLRNDVDSLYDPESGLRLGGGDEEIQAQQLGVKVKNAVLVTLDALQADVSNQTPSSLIRVFRAAAGRDAWFVISGGAAGQESVQEGQQESYNPEHQLLRQKIKNAIVEVAPPASSLETGALSPAGTPTATDDPPQTAASPRPPATGRDPTEDEQAALAQVQPSSGAEEIKFVERRGRPIQGTVYIHYRNFPTSFYYYFKDGEIGVIRNKPKPPEGAERTWAITELGDMDLFPLGTSGWTTLMGEMRDLIRDRKLVEVGRFTDTPADLGLVMPEVIPDYPDTQIHDFLKDQGFPDSQVESIMANNRLKQLTVSKMKAQGMTPAVGGRTGDIIAALPSDAAPEASEPVGRSRTTFDRRRHTWKIPEADRQAFDFGRTYGTALVKKITLTDSEPFEVTPELAFTGTRGPFIDVVIDVAPERIGGRRSLPIRPRNAAYDDIIEYIRDNSDNF